MDVLMPQLGETVAEGKISKWFVSAGDAVKPGDNLFEIETDKVSMEVPAIAAGTLSVIHVQAGEVAPVGAVVAQIIGAGEKARVSPPLIPAPGSDLRSARGQAPAGVQGKELGPRLRGDERKPNAPVPMEPFREVRTPERNFGPARLPGGTVVTPLARRLAGEAGIDLTSVKGSGPHGRIVARDVEQARSATAPAQQQARPHIILTADVGLEQSLALCADVPAIELADVIVKAWAVALQRVTPSEQSDIEIVIGKSRSVIRAAAGKSLTAIATTRRDPATADHPDASTAISMPNLPGIASIADVVRPPQTSTLSIGSRRRAPVEAADGAVTFVDMMTATLTCDRRVIDAALGAELLSAFKGFVEQPVRMIV
jgi:pyruvate/2-oxoglutarate dehydrogenase complex dihydrolipoamide acyltransferase (E2) component